MHVITARNVNDALYSGLLHLQIFGKPEPSRNGTVRVAPTPVCTVYEKPWERVVYSALRNANPFFHYLEALWMLAGRNDVAFPARYAAQLELYSDDNVTLNGAYGYRWREHFGYDQLDLIIEELKKNPASRRCVLAMWDAMADHDAGDTGYPGDLRFAIAGSKDVPCNTHVYFRVNAGSLLDMTVLCRSNDAIWGTYGANAVHFSILQEYVASMIGIGVGRYYQVANNFHIYTDRPDVQRLLEGVYSPDQRYVPNSYQLPPQVVPLIHDPATFDAELTAFMADPTQVAHYGNSSLNVGVLLARAHKTYKDGSLEAAIHQLEHVQVDWGVAAREWLKRIQASRALKAGAA